MPRGWKPIHKSSRSEAIRISRLSSAGERLLELPYAVLQEVATALLKRLSSLDSAEGDGAKRCIQELTAKLMDDDEVMINLRDIVGADDLNGTLMDYQLHVAEPFLIRLSQNGKLTARHDMSVIRLQRDCLHEYMGSYWDGVSPEAIARQTERPAKTDESCSWVLDEWPFPPMPETAEDKLKKEKTLAGWYARHKQRLFDELSFYKCICTYGPSVDLSSEDWKDCKGPGDLIPIILSKLHSSGSSTITPGTIRTYIKSR